MSEQKPFTFIKPTGKLKPNSPYPQAVKVNPSASVFYLSGLASRDKEGKGLEGYITYYGKSKTHPEPTGVYTQTMRVMERLKDVLHAAGVTFDDVIHAKVWITDIDYWENGVAEGFNKYFKQYPTVTVIALEYLGLGQMVEIELVAAAL